AARSSARVGSSRLAWCGGGGGGVGGGGGGGGPPPPPPPLVRFSPVDKFPPALCGTWRQV
ncbi:hypothetical protein I5I64_03415, partial [Pseudomonas aeruginosa]|nr:hypothetical protein [Pseudomonas aeruginosa]